MEKAKPRVAIIILNYNGIEDTLECLNSLKKCTYPNFEIVLVENGSEKDQVEKIKKIKMENLSVIYNKENFGFAGGNNVAIKRIIKEGKCKYIYFLNNDTVAEPDFLDWAVKRAESDEKIGLVASLSLQYYNRNIVDCAGHDFLNSGEFAPRGRFVKKSKYLKSREVMGASGCASLFRINTLLEVGVYNESYFLYAEDSDLSIRCISHGWKCVYEPRSVIFHKVSSSANKVYNFDLILRARVNSHRTYISNTPILVLLLNLPFCLASFVLSFFGYLFVLDFKNFNALIMSEFYLIKNIGKFLSENGHRMKYRKISSWYILRMQKFFLWPYFLYFTSMIKNRIHV